MGALQLSPSARWWMQGAPRGAWWLFCIHHRSAWCVIDFPAQGKAPEPTHARPERVVDPAPAFCPARSEL